MDINCFSGKIITFRFTVQHQDGNWELMEDEGTIDDACNALEFFLGKGEKAVKVETIES